MAQVLSYKYYFCVTLNEVAIETIELSHEGLTIETR